MPTLGDACGNAFILEVGWQLPGQFFFTLLNPAISVLLTATFAVLWSSRRNSVYLLVLAFAFLCNGTAFVMNDFLRAYEGPGLRLLVNAAFFLAILLSCLGAMLRREIAPPTKFFTALSAVTAGFFCWYLFVEPSTEARIYLINASFGLLTGVSAWMLIRAKPASKLDWLLVGIILLIFSFSVVRPLATWLGSLDLNKGGSINQSAYWNTVLAFTPILALVLALGFVAAFAAQMLAELRNEACRDYLTGLLNRRGFDREVTLALDACLKGELEPAIIIADIDDFKKINDSFGHGVGDKVIISVANVLARHGKPDAVARTGGEEFALFYSGARRAELLQTAELIRQELSRAELDTLPQNYPLTVSLGIHIRSASETLSEMMSKADQALYRAKTSGKDRAVMAPPALPLMTAKTA